VGNGSFDRCTAAAAIAAGRADAISFGSAFAANPDLPRRLLLDAPLAAADRSTFYGGGHQGYTDYPALKRLHE
jgi:N-ethylmaleimide reductase